MSNTDKILEAVSQWPRLHTGPGARGAAVAVFVDRRDTGPLHGDRSSHPFFPARVGDALRAEGRITEHPVFPGRHGPAARAIESDSDVADVVELLRINYERRTAEPDDDAA